MGGNEHSSTGSDDQIENFKGDVALSVRKSGEAEVAHIVGDIYKNDKASEKEKLSEAVRIVVSVICSNSATVRQAAQSFYLFVKEMEKFDQTGDICVQMIENGIFKEIYNNLGFSLNGSYSISIKLVNSNAYNFEIFANEFYPMYTQGEDSEKRNIIEDMAFPDRFLNIFFRATKNLYLVDIKNAHNVIDLMRKVGTNNDELEIAYSEATGAIEELFHIQIRKIMGFLGDADKERIQYLILERLGANEKHEASNIHEAEIISGPAFQQEDVVKLVGLMEDSRRSIDSLKDYQESAHNNIVEIMLETQKICSIVDNRVETLTEKIMSGTPVHNFSSTEDFTPQEQSNDLIVQAIEQLQNESKLTSQAIIESKAEILEAIARGHIKSGDGTETSNIANNNDFKNEFEEEDVAIETFPSVSINEDDFIPNQEDDFIPGENTLKEDVAREHSASLENPSFGLTTILTEMEDHITKEISKVGESVAIVFEAVAKRTESSNENTDPEQSAMLNRILLSLDNLHAKIEKVSDTQSRMADDFGTLREALENEIKLSEEFRKQNGGQE